MGAGWSRQHNTMGGQTDRRADLPIKEATKAGMGWFGHLLGCTSHPNLPFQLLWRLWLARDRLLDLRAGM